ncbi:hypothetical protein BDP81DRAFT_498224 [Colletotrichum phormii]|uniref:Uncharacterized protein n=1 Tax=Colletotrichum phormii TaxID=359342 RepID=A0AAJ0A4T8_9PEZI|nr:uncharacterized protein BDP81DRAFT_498224 [Colletotrichum phormii]KAK1655027.1 hypothetical protein BDP81DRAFT_498224 [Colletotrichum phormii]
MMPGNNKKNKGRQGTQSSKPISLSKGIQPTPSGKTGPASLSMDIILHIVDALITDAASKETTFNWGIAYKQDTASKLVLTDMNESGFDHVKAMKRRFSRIRMASQLNQKSCALVHQTYRCLPRATMSPFGMAVGSLMTAWVLPTTDDFVVGLKFVGGEMRVIQRYADFLGMALHLPTPEGLQFMECIQKFKIMLPQGFDKHVHAAMVLPNLKELHFTLCKIFKEKGTTVYACGCELCKPVFEMLFTEKGVRLRNLLGSNCPEGCGCREVNESQASMA